MRDRQRKIFGKSAKDTLQGLLPWATSAYNPTHGSVTQSQIEATNSYLSEREGQCVPEVVFLPQLELHFTLNFQVVFWTGLHWVRREECLWQWAVGKWLRMCVKVLHECEWGNPDGRGRGSATCRVCAGSSRASDRNVRQTQTRQFARLLAQ
jgi:hypothetical protein